MAHIRPLESIVVWEDGKISSELRRSINKVLNEVGGSDDSNKNAWALRKLLDRVYKEFPKEMEKEKVVSKFKPIVESAMPRGFPEPD